MEKELESGIEQVSEQPEYLLGYEGLSVRAVLTGWLIGFVICLMNFYMFLDINESSTGNFTSSLLGFALMNLYVRSFARWFSDMRQFGVAENLLVQTVATAAANLAYASGVPGPILSVQCSVVQGWAEAGKLSDKDSATDCAGEFGLGTIIAWVLITSFYGVFVSVPVYKLLVQQYKLPFPEGQAVAKMLQVLHVPTGRQEGKAQLKNLGFYSAGSFFVQFFQWGTGFLRKFPLFGIGPVSNVWALRFQPWFIGFGLLVPFQYSVYFLLGSIIGNGMILPAQHPKTSQEVSYYVTNYVKQLGIFIILCDGIYLIFRIIIVFVVMLWKRRSKKVRSVSVGSDDKFELGIGKRYWVTGMVGNIVLFTVVAKVLFPGTGITYAQTFVVSILTVVIGVPVVYGYGVTNQIAGSAAGKFGIMIIAVWNGVGSGASVTGPLLLASMMTSCAAMTSFLMTDMKAASLCGVNPRVLWVGQLIGVFAGVVGIIVGWELFIVAGASSLNNLSLVYAQGYRQTAIIFTQGLPSDALPYYIAGIVITLVVNLAKEVALCFTKNPIVNKMVEYWPSMLTIGMGMYFDPYYQYLMFIGGLIRVYWKYSNDRDFERFHASTSAGLIAGTAITSLICAILELAIPGAPWITTSYALKGSA